MVKLCPEKVEAEPLSLKITVRKYSGFGKTELADEITNI